MEPHMHKDQNDWFAFLWIPPSYTTTPRHWRQSHPTLHVDPPSLALSPKNPSCMVWKIAALPSLPMLPKARLTRSYLPHLFHQVLSIPSCSCACSVIITLVCNYDLLMIYLHIWSHQMKCMWCHLTWDKRDPVMRSQIWLTYHSNHNVMKEWLVGVLLTSCRKLHMI